MALPYKAVIFDMDGVLIDSEPFWRQAQIETLATYGAEITVEACIQYTMGKRLDAIASTWCQRCQLQIDPVILAQQILEKLIVQVRADGHALPGVHQLLNALKQAGYRIGLATSSGPEIIQAVLQRLEIETYFSQICSAEDEDYGKPHPAVYLSAAQKLDVSPDQCLVIEDSVTGMIAAKAASMTTFVVNAHQQDPRFALADQYLTSLEAIVSLIHVNN
ncbi:hexitol phosphatase HxpB [Vibrio spartinae]|uniref:2-deoxyglucose-6-phosphate phosphatase n=1 Tax=Vibrio spartinae TaxID=1918945 RepID=A0ABX6QZK9_9VIBR|nr:hexitol phosphatase HxpB [Vibrio spartinae]QMV14542.1 2-deoxyglucose-6-phosphate phosphatase [Vibrio spartinae]